MIQLLINWYSEKHLTVELWCSILSKSTP